MEIFDKRTSEPNKSLENRRRYVERATQSIKDAVSESLKGDGTIGTARKIRVSGDGSQEPFIHISNKGGDREYILPGNKKYVRGDTIPRPQEGGGGSGGAGGGGEDAYEFTLTEQEFLKILFSDCELPDLDKLSMGESDLFERRRAGYKMSGTPSQFERTETTKRSLGRRIALGRPSIETIDELEELIAQYKQNGTAQELQDAEKQLELLLEKRERVPYIDDYDVRYRRYEQVPKPNTQAVMFCLMDVSGSVTEYMKMLSKLFYTLLSVFLHTRYQHVDIVFIRHTDTAKEVDEQTFFHSRETGGTIVSSGIAEMIRIIRARYASGWNVYAAQASDGDNGHKDEVQVLELQKELLPLVQHFAYIEVGEESDTASKSKETTLWRTYKKISSKKFAMQKVTQASDIVKVFHYFFQKKVGS